MAHNFPQPPLSAASEKLSLLFKNLAQDEQYVNGSPKGLAYDELIHFSELLFSKAPADFLQQSSVSHLSKISKSVFEFFRAYEKTQNELFFEKNFLNNTYCICAILEDRPFIVDTLHEHLRQAECEVSVVLHPVLVNSRGKRVSLTYIELVCIKDGDSFEKLALDMQKGLRLLITVTNDFPQMVERANHRAEILRRRTFDGATDPQEVGEFLRWAAHGGFVLLGYAKWNIPAGKKTSSSLGKFEDALGLLRFGTEHFENLVKTITAHAEYYVTKNEIIEFGRTSEKSPVHRFACMDLVTLFTPSTTHTDGVIECFLGLLTTRAVAQEAALVPIVRKKLHAILDHEKLVPNSHDYKELVSIVDGIPKLILLRTPTELLRNDIRLIMEATRRRDTRLSVHQYELFQNSSVMVIMPRNRFSGRVRESIQEYIEKEFNSSRGATEYQLALGDEQLVRIHYFVPNIIRNESALDLPRLEYAISRLTLTWDDNLQIALSETSGAEATRLATFYRRAFPEQYKAATSPRQAAFDIKFLEVLSPNNNLEIAVWSEEDKVSTNSFYLKLYKRDGTFTLSTVLPFLENTGLEIIDESANTLMVEEQPWATVYSFHCKHGGGIIPHPEMVEKIIVPGLKDIFAGRADNDHLNALLFSPNLSSNRIAVLRAVSDYLWQLKVFPARSTLHKSLVQNPEHSKLLVEYFETKFDPSRSLTEKQRATQLKKLEDEFFILLKKVPNLTFDRVLRGFLNTLQAIVRTNYYRPSADSRIAFKIDCKRIRQMPSPRPLYEIFVSSPDFEGVHLRGGKVARGGIRWSERKEDYRTEILGLMKTQVVKNSIIVPVGAKGGFIIKENQTTSKTMQEQVRECYTKFIISLLEITDTLSGEKIKHPEHVLIYDDDDPYLVVAADRGTATFSDLANQIAQESFDFWLGDAFASGGSQGYSHKELGITARGAWEASLRHFRELGIDVDQQSFTLVGIGDMSGDVFGNGLLLNKNAKLIAAFNHKHIFVDPNPDCTVSFQERERLFHLPTSQWSDYSLSTISPGGGVFERSEKEIALSSEAKKALGCEKELLSGDELVQAVLKAPVDLIFNGGIGTYVKAERESHIDVGDRINDDVRVDAKELRAKIACEGGNLGFTQLARIEFAINGGQINTDAVDNSGGVDLSDFEVNLKILLSAPVKRGELSLPERNEILRKCASDAVKKVTARNRLQSKALSLGVRRSKRNIDYYRALIQNFVSEKLLDRKGEFLPDDETLLKRGQTKQGLTRPELAVLIAYVKMSLFNSLLTSDLTDEPFLRRYLFSYFPSTIVERFREDTLKHPLAREIISSQIANLVVERMGATFVNRTAEETGASDTDIIFAFLAADEILGAAEISEQLRTTDTATSASAHLNALFFLTRAIDDLTRWLLEHRSAHLTWSEVIDRYRKSCKILLGETTSFLTQVELSAYQEKYGELLLVGFPKTLAQSVSSIVYANSLVEITDISSDTATDLLSAAKLYSQIATEFSVTRLIEQSSSIESTDRWEALALRVIVAQLKDSVGLVVKSIIHETGGATAENIQRFLEKRKDAVKRYNQSVNEFQSRNLTVSALLVIANQLYGISRPASK